MAEDQGPIVGDGRGRRTEGRRTEAAAAAAAAAGWEFLEARAQFSSTCREANEAPAEGEQGGSVFGDAARPRLVTQCKGDGVHAGAQDSWRNRGRGRGSVRPVPMAAAVVVVTKVMMPGKRGFLSANAQGLR